jgi:FHA domain
VLGFEPQPAAVVPLFDEGRMEDSIEPSDKAGVVMYPTGWLVIKDGPGRGAAFPVLRGISQIGRGTDQTIALDFGDMSISRQHHAAIAYDPSSHQFHVGHGGKSNLVRLNGKPLLSTEVAGDGDEIQIGETTLVLKVLCTPDFNWSSVEAEGDGHDMAIA